MVLGVTADATCARISSLDADWVATAGRSCVNLDMHLYYPAIQNLVYRCGNVSHTSAETSDTPPIYCALHVQQSVNMSIQLPAGLHCDPFQMAEVVQQKYILIDGA